jgi:hypothetical protein
MLKKERALFPPGTRVRLVSKAGMLRVSKIESENTGTVIADTPFAEPATGVTVEFDIVRELLWDARAGREPGRCWNIFYAGCLSVIPLEPLEPLGPAGVEPSTEYIQEVLKILKGYEHLK